MDRRAFVRFLSGAAIAGFAKSSPAASGLRVVVAGAGIIGASIAYHLQKAGASVTVIDKAGPASHASRCTFAWINATWAKQPQHYHALSQDSVSSWKSLQSELNLPIRWGGSFEWFDDAERQARLVEQIAEQVAWGEPARMLGADEVAALEPELAVDEELEVAYSPNDGAVDPVLATQRLLEAAQKHGAELKFPAELVDVSLSDVRLTAVETSEGSIPADRLVLATGADPDASRRFAGIEIPQRSTPGVIAITKPADRLVHRVVIAPGVHLHQRDDGRIVLGEQDGAPDTEAHSARLADRPNDFPSEAFAREHAERMLAVAGRFYPAIADAEFESACIGWRPLPVDGHPVLGVNPERPDVYMAVMHSGVTLAPIIGHLVAQELTQDMSVFRLDPYRPTRAFATTRRY